MSEQQIAPLLEIEGRFVEAEEPVVEDDAAGEPFCGEKSAP